MNYKYLFQRPGAVGDAPVAVHLFRGLVAAAHATTGDPHPCGTSYTRNGVYLQTDCYATYKMVAAPGMPSVGCGGLTLRSVTYRRTARIASCSRMPLRSRHHRHTMIQKGKLLISQGGCVRAGSHAPLQTAPQCGAAGRGGNRVGEAAAACRSGRCVRQQQQQHTPRSWMMTFGWTYYGRL